MLKILKKIQSYDLHILINIIEVEKDVNFCVFWHSKSIDLTKTKHDVTCSSIMNVLNSNISWRVKKLFPIYNFKVINDC